ncbi:MAG: hypothetical protein OHK0044_33570 [Burkholderiaceae bacterium]
MRARQRGAAGLLMMLLVVLTLGTVLVGSALGVAGRHVDTTPRALALAAQTLAGYARAQRCQLGTGAVVDHLPCPNVGAPEGIAAPVCPGTVRGRLPWRTLGLPPLRDAAGECLWYERSPLGARVIAPGTALAGQSRAASGAAPMCGGDYNAADYLEAIGGNDTALALSAAALALPTGCP